jgi:hypothetical protein
MSDPSEMEEKEFDEKLERLEAQLDKALETFRDFGDKYKSFDDFPDEALIPYIHNLDNLCNLYSSKGDLFRSSVEATYGVSPTYDPDSMAEHVMSEIDKSDTLRGHGTYVLSIIRERKIPVNAYDLSCWWKFDQDLLMNPEPESYNIVDRGEGGF